MCVIVHQPVGAHLTKETATKLWKTNSDGGGFAFINDDEEIEVKKSMNFESFWSQFEPARSDFPRRDFMLHMRIATHGAVTIDNVHPFPAGNGLVAAHNGIIHKVTEMLKEDEQQRSDTRYFLDEVLPRLPDNWLDDPYLFDMVEDWIGWSRMMFLNVNPSLQHTWYRLGDWVQHEGLYLTNKNGLYSPKPVVQTATPAGTQRYTTPSRTVYSEDAAAWDAWEDFRERRDRKNRERSPDLDLLADAIKEERLHMGLTASILWIDDDPLEAECIRCDTPVELETGECACWDLVCGACWNFLAVCDLTMLCMSIKTSKYEYDSLSEKGQSFVNTGGRKAKFKNNPINQRKQDEEITLAKMLALPLPKGAENTTTTSSGTTGPSTSDGSSQASSL